jgi:hypothetical protein
MRVVVNFLADAARSTTHAYKETDDSHRGYRKIRKSSLGDQVQAVLGWLKRQSTKPR